MKFFLLFLTILFFIPTTIQGTDSIDVSISGLKNTYKIGEFMEFTVQHTGFCGDNFFSVEESETGKKISELAERIGCEPEETFGDFENMAYFYSGPVSPGDQKMHLNPNVTSYEGSFKFVYEAGDVRKEWRYEVFEKIPLHLDQEAHIRLAMLAIGYLVFTLYVYKDDLAKKLRK